MSAAHPTTSNAANHYYWVVAFVVVLLVLIASCGLFFAVERVPDSAVYASLGERGSLDSDANNDGNVDGIVDPLIRVSTIPVQSVRGSLDIDADNEGSYDDITNSPVGLASVPLFILLLGRLSLAFCELPRLSSICSSALERPG